MMELKVGDYVIIEGADRHDPWEVTAVNKYSVDVRDTGMKIIEIEGVPLEDILEIISSEDLVE